jgi:TonB-linked SusC/RagA family outer membrane protein
MKSKLNWKVLHAAACLLAVSSFGTAAFAGDFAAGTPARPGHALLDRKMADRVSGQVTDEQKNPIAGVSVSVKGTSSGTTTDDRGNFSLEVEAGQTIVFSSIGFETKEIRYHGQNKLVVMLAASSANLDEVVAIGYGTTTRKEVTGSVTTLKAEDFNKGTVVNPIGLIQGKVPGLNIIRTQGNDPNGGYQILLRGLNTLSGGKQPLIIVDGIVGTNTLDMLDPNEVESVDVLKDGSAGSIYGTRATNGVILITTKKAKQGTVRYEFTTNVSTDRLAEHRRFFNAAEYRNVVQQYYPDLASSLDKGASTDWLKEITRDPVSQQYSFAATGGTDKINFRADLYYKDNEGIVKRSSAKTLTPSIFVSSTGLNGRLKIDARLMYSFIKREGGNNDAIFQAIVRNPTWPVYDPDDVVHGGYYTVTSASLQPNPVAMINEHVNNVEQQLFSGDLMASYKLFDALKLNLHYSYNSNQDYNGSYMTRYYPDLGTNGEATVSTDFQHDILFEPGVEFKKGFGDHQIQAVAGYSYFESQSEGLDADNHDFPLDDFSYYNIGAGSALGLGLASMSSSKVSNKLISFYGRVMYNYKQRYLLSVSTRYEGSSRFGINNKWGMFPAVSVGWRVTEEEFARNLPVLSMLKLRAGYGVTGNQDIPNYQSISRIGTTSRLFYNGGEWLNSYAPSGNPNPDLRWEKKGEFDAGIDFGLWHNRITGTFDFYTRRVSDLLWNYTVPVPPNVYPTTYANVGVMQNHGIEVSLTADPVRTGQFQWSTTVLYSTNRNKLVSFSNADRGYKLDFLKINPVNGTWSQLVLEGQPVGNFVAPIYLGVKDNGDAIYKDVNGDGKIDVASTDDREIVGNAYPKFELGWTNQLRYNRFDLTFFFRGVFGHSLVNYERALYENWKPLLSGTNIVKSILDYPDYKGVTTYDSRYVEKASYVKFENLALGYTIHMPRVGSLRVYASCQNLFTLTNYKGVDPEVPISNFDLRPAVNGVENLNYYPYTKTFLIGANLNF